MFHHDQGVRQTRHFVGSVGDVKHGNFDLVAQTLEPRQDVLSPRMVKRGQGLIKEQQARLERKRPRNRHPLALTAGELMGAALK